jgi:two-component system response regulator QseB
MRILIVEDDVTLAAPVADDLRRQNHVVEVVSDGGAAVAFGASGVYDVILLDVMLPVLDGLEVCRRLRREHITSMILMLTGRDATSEKIAALDAGADDYVVKPFDLAEISARVRALARRGFAARSTVLAVSGLEIDQQAVEARYDGRRLALTPKEYAILETLMRSPKQVFSRAMLAEKLGPFEHDRGEESIKTHVGNVRKKLREAGCSFDPIATVYGSGYRLAEPK